MNLVYANTTTTVTLSTGVHVLVRWGEHWPANDPVVIAHPGLFTSDPTPGLRVSSPLVDDGKGSELVRTPDEQPLVEEATAAPGERRRTRRG